MIKLQIGEVATTGFLTLYCHAIESQSNEPILKDQKSVEVVKELNKLLSRSGKKLDKIFVKGKINKALVTHITIRAKKYDEYVRDFLEKYEKGIVVNIGCGLDSRFSRIDNGKVFFYDLDLPEMTDIKRLFFKETSRYRIIASSVLDYNWMSIISKHEGPFLFMAEGVFMYLNQTEVESLILKLQKEFSGSELVCEVFNSFWLKWPLKSLINFKMRKELHLGKDITFNFGIRNSEDFEKWNKGIQFLDDWSYFDSNEKKLGQLKMLGKIELLRKTQWTVHYRLN